MKLTIELVEKALEHAPYYRALQLDNGDAVFGYYQPDSEGNLVTGPALYALGVTGDDWCNGATEAEAKADAFVDAIAELTSRDYFEYNIQCLEEVLTILKNGNNSGDDQEGFGTGRPVLSPSKIERKVLPRDGGLLGTQ